MKTMQVLETAMWILEDQVPKTITEALSFVRELLGYNPALRTTAAALRRALYATTHQERLDFLFSAAEVLKIAGENDREGPARKAYLRVVAAIACLASRSAENSLIIEESPDALMGRGLMRYLREASLTSPDVLTRLFEQTISLWESFDEMDYVEIIPAIDRIISDWEPFFYTDANVRQGLSCLRSARARAISPWRMR